MTPLCVTIKEAAATLGLSTWTLRKLIAEGHLPVVKFPSTRHVGEPSRRVLISVADLEAYVATVRVGGLS